MTSLPRLHVLISADYEVFLGRNYGTDDEVLFHPTADLLCACENSGVPLTLFADVCSAWAHRKHGLNKYADKFSSQLRDAVAKGHDVQLHIHPHWTVVSRIANEWRLTEQLIENGFKIDSSIAKGYSLKLDTVHIDYKSTPKAANWFLDSEHALLEGARTGLFEIPICTFQTSIINRVLFLVRRALAVRQLRGAAIFKE